jgi:hypothetical protein
MLLAAHAQLTGTLAYSNGKELKLLYLLEAIVSLWIENQTA